MRCKDIEKLLPLCARGELAAEQLVRVAAHLDRCPACSGLLERLRRTEAALSGIAEIEPGPALMARLRNIPSTAQKRRRFPSFVLAPSLQPVLAGAFLVLVFTATMVFTPAGGRLLKTIDRQVHAGYSKITRLYARAESVADSLGGAGEKVIVSLETLPPLGRSQE